jgi:hypothetical protein
MLPATTGLRAGPALLTLVSFGGLPVGTIMYLVETERWGAAEPAREEVEDASVVLAKIQAAEADLHFLMVADIRDRVDHGNFLVWLNGDRAFVRLDEHREHYATDPLIRDRRYGVVRFGAGADDGFEVPFAESVSRKQALQALELWLRTGHRSPELEWS